MTRGWAQAAERAELAAIYAETDTLLAGWTCTCSKDAPTCAPAVRDVHAVRCCHFSLTGREPHVTPVELAEVHYGMRAQNVALKLAPSGRRGLPMVPSQRAGACPLLSVDGRCRIYPSRPFGCRTFFCDGAHGPYGTRAKLPRQAIRLLSQRLSALSARFAPRDPGPRPLARALFGAR